jgi:hypothetical protein
MRVGPIGPSPSGATRLPRSVPTAVRSAPAQNTPPSPCRTATAAVSSASKARKAAARASAVAPSTALRRADRESSTVVTGPARSTRTAGGSVAGCGVAGGGAEGGGLVTRSACHPLLPARKNDASIRHATSASPESGDRQAPPGLRVTWIGA